MALARAIGRTPRRMLARVVGNANRKPALPPVYLGLLDDGQAHVITAAQLLAGATGPDNVALTIVSLAVTAVRNGSGDQVDSSRAELADNGDGTWTLTLADNWRGTVGMTLTVTDGQAEVSGTVSASVEHVLWRNDGDRTDNVLVYLPDGPLSSVADPDGGYRLETVAPNTESFGVRSWPSFLPASSGDRLRVSWKFEPESGGTYVLPAVTFYRSGNEWMTEASAGEFPYGVGSWEFDVPGGAESLALLWYVYGVPAGKKLWMDDLLLVRRNAALVVTGPVTLAPIDEDGTATIYAYDLLSAVSDSDLDGTLLVTDLQVDSGSLSLMYAQAWVYMPNPDWSGTATFTFTASDGVASVQGTATLEVLEINDPPYAGDVDLGTVRHNDVLTIYDFSITSRSGDYDGSMMVSVTSFALTTPGAGDLYDYGYGVWDFWPSDQFTGTASFAFTVSDDQGLTASATATATVVASN